MVVGQGRLGVGLLSLIATLREELRLPIGASSGIWPRCMGWRLSVGAIVGALHTVAARAAPLVADLQAAIRASPVLHVDETGWREDGRNGYVWTFSTATARAFVRGSRERAVLEAAMGDDYAGVLVSDFYAAYTTYEGATNTAGRICCATWMSWSTQHRGRCRRARLGGWRARPLPARHGAVRRADPAARRQARQAVRGGARRPVRAVPGRRPAARSGCCASASRKHLSELFVFVEDPAVPADQQRRRAQPAPSGHRRKISGGTRSPAGRPPR